MEAAEYNALLTAFKSQTAIQPSKNDPFSMSLFVQYIIASNLSGMTTGFDDASATLTEISETLSAKLAGIETKLGEISAKLADIEDAIRTTV